MDFVLIVVSQFARRTGDNKHAKNNFHENDAHDRRGYVGKWRKNISRLPADEYDDATNDHGNSQYGIAYINEHKNHLGFFITKKFKNQTRKTQQF